MKKNRSVTFVALAAALIVIVPVLIAVLNAFKTPEDLDAKTLWPTTFTLRNFEQLSYFNFPRFMLNSFIVAGAGTLAAVIPGILAGYALSRFRQRGLTLYSGFLFASQMIPGVLTLIPLFIIISKLGLVNTQIALIFIYGAILLPFATIIGRGFFDAIPIELEEAAWVDGCSRLQALRLVVARLSLPGLASIATISFITAWNEFMLANIFLRSAETRTVSVGLQLFAQQQSTDWGAVMAGATIAMIPTIAVSIIFQRFLVSGALSGAVKG